MVSDFCSEVVFIVFPELFGIDLVDTFGHYFQFYYMPTLIAHIIYDSK